MEPGLIAALGAAAATITGLVKTASPVEPARWLSSSLVLALSVSLVTLGVVGGEIQGSPLDVVLWSVEVALAGMGGRAALQAGYEASAGKPLELRSRGPALERSQRTANTTSNLPRVLGFTIGQGNIATCPVCAGAVALEDGSSSLQCVTGHSLALDVPYRADRPLDYFYRATVQA